MGTAAKLNVIGLLVSALGMFGAYFLWSANRWIQYVEAQSASLVTQQHQVMSAHEVMEARFDILMSELREVKERLGHIEQNQTRGDRNVR